VAGWAGVDGRGSSPLHGHESCGPLGYRRVTFGTRPPRRLAGSECGPGKDSVLASDQWAKGRGEGPGRGLSPLHGMNQQSRLGTAG
jgi:hypothetical protein